MFTFGVGSREELYGKPVLWAAAVGLPAFQLMAVAGGLAAGLGWRAGIVVLLLGFVGTIAVHLLMGIVDYRRVMSRPWPKVAPLEDEDEW